MKLYKIIFTVCFYFLIATAFAKVPVDILDKAITFDPAQNRTVNSSKLIEQWIAVGMIDPKPNAVFDYDNLYFLKQPVTYMNQELVAVIHERIETFIGCCVNPGLILIFESPASQDPLIEFAKKNHCSVDAHFNLKEEFENSALPKKFTKKEFFKLSCRDQENPIQE